MNKSIMRIIGVLLIILGIVGGAIPILQGWLLIGAGIVLIIASLAEEKRKKIWLLEDKKGIVGKTVKSIRKMHEKLSLKYEWLR
jgi:uncharacterized protein YqgC (DUF456 family)